MTRRRQLLRLQVKLMMSIDANGRKPMIRLCSYWEAQMAERAETPDSGAMTPPAPAAADVGQFDGSADPNPGGRMGMGWHLTMRDGTEYSGASEQAAAPGNSNNQ